MCPRSTSPRSTAPRPCTRRARGRWPTSAKPSPGSATALTRCARRCEISTRATTLRRCYAKRCGAWPRYAAMREELLEPAPDAGDLALEVSLRPRTLAEFVGQAEL